MKRFQFTIRNLLLFIVIAALAAGWWIDHQRINRLAVQKWEYTYGDWQYQELAKNGDEGWEVCGVEFDHSTNNSRVLYKRPKR